MALIATMENVFSPFQAHPLVRGGHLQTVIGKMTGSLPAATEVEDLYFTFPDGDRVFFRVDHPKNATAETPIVALFHGLAGSCESGYNVRISSKLRPLGFRVARFNHRGCGTLDKSLARKIYHSGSSDDAHEALKVLTRKWPKAPIFAVGFSLSATILLNLLGRIPDLGAQIPQLKSALTVCPPVDLEKSSLTFQTRQNFIYNQYFTRHLIKQVHGMSEVFPEMKRTNFSSRFLTLRDFDEEFTAIHGGFANRLDYYTKSSPNTVSQHIRLPTLLLGADDDPVVAPENYPKMRLSPVVKLRVEKSGGHMGFISSKKTRFGDYRWMDLAVVDWAQAQLKNL